MNTTLTTERLLLREFTPGDTDFIIELVNSPGWLQFIGDRNIRTEESARKYLVNGPIKSYGQHGFGLSMVALKDDHSPIGMCGILKRDSLDTPDIGFAFLPQFMGLGYAFEIASAVMTHAREQLKLPAIAAITDPDNKSSIKLLEKIGLKFKKTFKSPTDGKELMLFRDQE